MTGARTGRWLRLALGAGATIALLLIAGEVAARLFLPVSDIPWHEGDPLLGYRLRGNQAGHCRGEHGLVSFRLNALGWNNDHEYDTPRQKGRARIAILGDSYVESLYVGRGRRFFDLLEERLGTAGHPTEVFTYGVSGYGTGQEMLLLESEVERHAPDAVVVIFTPPDLVETACALAPSPEVPCFFGADADSLDYRRAVPHQPNRRARALMSSALLRYAAIDLDLLDSFQRWRARNVRFAPMMYALHPPEKWQEAWIVVEACLTRMARRCRARGIPFLVIPQPVIALESIRDIEAMPDGGDPELPARRLKELAQRESFAFFDLSGAFPGCDLKTGYDRFRAPRFGHWNEEAHAAVAVALVPPITALLAEAPPPAR